MNLVFITDNISRGGKERQLTLLSSSLLKNGHIVNIFTKHISSYNYLNEYNIDESIVTVYGTGNRLNDFLKIKKLILLTSPEIVITWDFTSSIFALLLYKKFKFNFINASLRHGIRLPKISHFIRSITFHLSPIVVANSKAGLKANNLFPSEKRIVINNGVEWKFRPDDNMEMKLKKRNIIAPFLIDSNRLLLISVANLLPIKDYLTVLAALQKVKESLKFYYLIIGDGPMRKQIESAIQNYNLEDCVFLIGKTIHVADFLAVSDLFIHSSKGEGISNAILEAMFSGLPVISTNVGGVPETVFPPSSILFKYKDVDELYQSILAAKTTIISFDRNSEEYLNHLDKFSVGQMVKRFEDLINSVVERRKRS